MTDQDAPPAAVLLSCHESRRPALIRFGAALIVGAICLYLLFVNLPFATVISFIIKFVAFIALLIAAFVGWTSLQRFLKPRLLVEAKKDGIYAYSAIQSYLREPFLLPWDRIKGLEYFERSATEKQGKGGLVVKTIGLTIRVDENWPPYHFPKAAYDPAGQIFHLDAGAGSLQGPALHAELHRLWQAHGGKSKEKPSPREVTAAP